MLPKDQRYIRQTILPLIGESGQKRLAKKKVLISGVGGLGSVSGLYLAAAGIGHILIADHDDVNISNLNRQIIHGEDFINQSKVLSAKARLSNLNSSVRITTRQEKITKDNIDSLAAGVDLILDGSDNYSTRQLLNRASIRHKIPFIFGGVQGFDGMVSVFIPERTACFECIFRPPSQKQKSQNESSQGIIGPAAGITASIQAMEAVKVLLGIGQTLENRLLRFSGMDMKFSSTKLTINPDCPAHYGKG